VAFEWDQNNLRKVRAHRIKPDEAEQVLENGPLLVYEQNVEGEIRFLYYGETHSGRLLAIVMTERGDHLRVVTGYDLDAGQRRDHFQGRAEGG
jgi:uncharacterized DUF497 family protein